MKGWQILLLGIYAVGGIGVLMALTNPDRDAYESYAVERVSDLARAQCDRAPAGFGVILQGPCRSAIDSFKPQIRPLLSATTSRLNYVFFSLYKSDISIPAANFNAQVESIGIFNNFFTYKTP
jgi:Domain of unknown function (DUF4359)